jgi:hypothetical protein
MQKRVAPALAVPLYGSHNREVHSIDLFLFQELVQEQLQMKMSVLERDIFLWHRSNLEYGCGSNLDGISLTQWDQGRILLLRFVLETL